MQWRSSPDRGRTPAAGVRGHSWRPGRSVRSRLMLSILAMSALALALAGDGSGTGTGRGGPPTGKGTGRWGGLNPAERPGVAVFRCPRGHWPA